MASNSLLGIRLKTSWRQVSWSTPRWIDLSKLHPQELCKPCTWCKLAGPCIAVRELYQAGWDGKPCTAQSHRYCQQRRRKYTKSECCSSMTPGCICTHISAHRMAEATWKGNTDIWTAGLKAFLFFTIFTKTNVKSRSTIKCFNFLMLVLCLITNI